MIKYFALSWFIWLTQSSSALSMDDFTPDFLSSTTPTESSINPRSAFSIPEKSKKRNASNGSAWYCDRVQNVFCNKQNASVVVEQTIESVPVGTLLDVTQGNGKYLNRNNNNYDQNALANFNITDSNQTALQVYSPKLNTYSTEETLKNNLAVPIQANKNTNINIGQQQIEFNIQY